MRIAAYARVSTEDQHLDAQLTPLRAYGARVGADVAEYTDTLSGRRPKRPGLDALLAAVRRREVDVVAIVKLDRLARSVRDLTQIAGELAALRVELVVLDQAIDTRTPSGRLLFSVLGAIAEFEADLIRERTIAGLAAARRRGRKPGRPSKLGADAVKRAQRLAASGQSIRAIAATLDCSPVTALRAVRGRR
jgi:DNA invertase Pin-like site-specific DNA recombinase